jgi:hypothetical protein
LFSQPALSSSAVAPLMLFLSWLPLPVTLMPASAFLFTAARRGGSLDFAAAYFIVILILIVLGHLV